MRLSVKHLRTNEYTHDDDEVPEGTPYGFWRIVEYTGRFWFPWPGLHHTREQAERAMHACLEKGYRPW